MIAYYLLNVLKIENRLSDTSNKKSSLGIILQLVSLNVKESASQYLDLKINVLYWNPKRNS